jgi:hypothetical protein
MNTRGFISAISAVMYVPPVGPGHSEIENLIPTAALTDRKRFAVSPQLQFTHSLVDGFTASLSESQQIRRYHMNAVKSPVSLRPRICAYSLLAALICLALSVLGVAQNTNTGAIEGTVSDQTGAVISGATVTISSRSGTSRSQSTNGRGEYSFPLLSVGEYSMSITAPGFKALNVSSIAVTVTEIRNLNEKLDVGNQSQQVVVAAEAETTETESATLGGVVEQQALRQLPLVTRNWTQVESLSPGVTTDVYNAANVGRGSIDPTVNGNNDTSNNIEMDGAEITSYETGETTNLEGFYGDIPVPSADAIQEMKVQTSNEDAGFGVKAGSNIDIVTKSGTNSRHGTLFEYVRNDDLDANGFFQNQLGLRRGAMKQNQFGGTFGGPIRKDKAFFFFSYQGTRQVNGVNSLGYEEDLLPEQLTNNRSAATLGAEFCPANNPIGSPGAQYAYTYNPSGAMNPASDQVACDGSNINPVALNLLSLKVPTGQMAIPTPTLIESPSTSSAVGAYAVSIPATFSEDQVIGNIDYVFSQRNTLHLRYFYSYGTENRPFNCASAGCLPGSGAENPSGNQLATIKLTTIATSHLVNEARISFYYIRSSINSKDPFTTSQLGINGIASSWDQVPPVITVNGLLNFGGSPVDGAKSPTDSLDFADQISWQHGRQSISTGYEGIPLIWNISAIYPDRGTITFESWADFLLGESAAQNGTTLSNLFSSNASLTAVGGTYNPYRAWTQDAFIQDDIKLTPRLTANLGLRWDYDGWAWDASGQLVNSWWSLAQTVPVPPTTGTFAGYTVAANYPGTAPAGIFRRPSKSGPANTTLDNFAPRAGIEWQPFNDGGRFVVRAGSGIFYNAEDGNDMINYVNGGVPEAVAEGFSNTANAAATFQVPFTANRALGFASSIRTPTSALSVGSNDEHMKTATIIASNLNIQYEFHPNWIAQLAYVNDRGERDFATIELNQPQLASPTNPLNCALPTGCVTTNTAANYNQRVPVVGYASTGFTEDGPFGDYSYNGLQASLRKAYSNGLQFQASYTFGRTLTDMSGIDFHSAGGMTSNDTTNFRQMRAEADYDRPQRLVVSYAYSTPRYHDGAGFAGKALSAWTISGVTTLQSGEPQTLTDTTGGAVYGQAGTSRAQYCPGMTASDLRTQGSVKSRINGFYNRSALADTSITSGSSTCTIPVVGAVNGVGGATGYGNVPRDVIRGPDQENWDIAAGKTVQIEKYGAVNFQAQFFNAFNHSQFSPPGDTANAGTFGVISSTTVAGRIVQFALRYDF